MCSWSDLRCILANAERRDQLVDRQLSRRNRPEPEGFAPTFPSLIGRHFNEQGVSYLQVLITPSGCGIRYRCIADEGLEARHGADIVSVRLQHSSRLAYRQRPRAAGLALSDIGGDAPDLVAG
jgi:hypothetical protein